MALQNFKNTIKRIIPYNLWQWLRLNHDFLKRTRPPFRGIYSRYADVPKTDAYNSDAWSKASLSTTAACIRQIGEPIPEILSPSKALLPAVASMMACYKDKIKILDFGGATGLDYASLLAQTCNRIDVDYHVIDVPQICKNAQSIWPNARITFSSDWPKGNFDIAYSYSAIHCIEDYALVLKRMTSVSPDVILLCKHPVHHGKSFARQQINLGRGKELAQWVLGLSEVESILHSEGYRLLFRNWGEDIYNVSNYPNGYKIGQVCNLLFIRAQK